MSQNMFYPPSGGGSSTNASVGSNGAPAPTSSTEIAGKNAGGNLQPFLAGPNGEFVVQPPLAINVTGTLSALGTVLTQDCSQLQSASIHLTAMGAGNVVSFQVSNDNTNWYSCAMMPGGDLASIITSSASVIGSFTTQLNSRYFRAQVTTYGSGTITGNAYFKSFGNSPNSVGGYVSAQVYDSTGVGITSTGAALDINLKTSTITLPVSAAALPLPAGAATSALQTALNAQVPTTLGQKAMAASLAIVVASDQTAIPIAQATAANLNATVVQTTAANLNATVSIAAAQTLNTVNTVGAVTAITNALPAGTNIIGAITEAGTASATNANSSAASAALETSRVVKASAGRLYQLTGVNTKATAQYIQIYNSATVPVDTSVPILLAYVGAGANFSFDFGPIGRYFSTGISVSNSSTAATKTIGSADCWFNAEYV